MRTSRNFFSFSGKTMEPPAELIEEWCRQLFGCDDKPEVAAYELARLGAAWAKEQLNPKADRVSIWIMRDNHTFVKVETGQTAEEVVAEVQRICQNEAAQGDWPSLCPAVVLTGEKELRRVGKMAFYTERGSERKKRWRAGLMAWREALEADEEVVALLKKRPPLESGKLSAQGSVEDETLGNWWGR